MLEHALSTPDLEVCGLIGGRDNIARTVYPITNIADDPTHRFLMGPKEQINIMRRMREVNELLWGIYHSHPDSPAEPSALDLDMAYYPDVYYFIISLTNNQSELGCFYFDGLKFKKINLNFY